MNIYGEIKGRVTMSLPDVSPACNGGQLELNCTIIGSIVQWRIIPDQNHSQLITQSYIPTRNQSIQYGDSIITLTVISHPMELTIIYEMVISSISSSLNGTVVECADIEDQRSTSTIISVVDAQGISHLQGTIL